jgi:hypothetical protein
MAKSIIAKIIKPQMSKFPLYLFTVSLILERPMPWIPWPLDDFITLFTFTILPL